MEAKDASDDDGDGFWPTRPKAAKDDGRPSDPVSYTHLTLPTKA